MDFTECIGLDIETTGFDPEKDHIIEIALIKWPRSQDLAASATFKSFQSLIRPGVPIPAAVTHITGINNEDTKNAPLIADLRDQISDFIGDRPILGHNINFDVTFLKYFGFSLEKNLLLDTLDLVSIAFPEAPSFSLEALSRRLNLDHVQKHRAYHDVLVTFFLLKKIQEKFASLPPQLNAEILKVIAATSWPWKFLFLTPHQTPPTANSKFNFTRNAPRLTSDFTPNPKVQNLLNEFFDGEDNLIAEFQEYDFQDLVTAALNNKQKSLISASRILNFPAQTEIGVIYNPEQYFCNRRFQEFVKKKPLTNDEIPFIIKCLIWRQITKTGLQFELPMVKTEKQLWNLICSDPLYCDECQDEECFFSKNLKQLSQKKIIITVHTNLSRIVANADSYALNLKKYRLIIDNAEELESNFNQGLSQRFHIFGFDHLITALESNFPPESAFFHKIKSSIEIIFGLFGIVHQKYSHPQSFQKSEIELNAEIAATLEWHNIQISLSNLIKNLSEKPFSHYLFQKLSQKLSDLYEKTTYHPDYIFRIILTSSADIIIITKPISSATLINSNLFEKFSSFALLSANILTNADPTLRFQFIKSELNLHDKKLREIYLPPSKSQKIPLITPYPLDEPNQPETLSHELKFLNEQLLFSRGHTIILTNSLNNIKNLFYNLASALKANNLTLLAQNLTGGSGKIIDYYRCHPESTIVIGTYEFFFNIMAENPDLQFQNLILHRLYFDHPKNPEVIRKSAKYTNAFLEFCLPRVIIKLKKALHLFTSHHGQTIYNLDARLDKDFGQKIRKALPHYIDPNPFHP